MTAIDDAPTGAMLAAAVAADRDALVAAVMSATGASYADAEDTVQAVLLHAVERGVPVATPADAFRWLRRVSFNRVWKERSRTAHRTPLATDDVPETIALTPDPADLLLRAERAGAVRAALAALPEHYREVLLRRFVEDQQPREIAADLALPVATVKSRLQRATSTFLREFRRAGLAVIAVVRVIRRDAARRAAPLALVTAVVLTLLIEAGVPLPWSHRSPDVAVEDAGRAPGDGREMADGHRAVAVARVTDLTRSTPPRPAARRAHPRGSDDVRFACVPDSPLWRKDYCFAREVHEHPDGMDEIVINVPEPLRDPVGYKDFFVSGDSEKFPFCDVVPSLQPYVWCVRR